MRARVKNEPRESRSVSSEVIITFWSQLYTLQHWWCYFGYRRTGSKHLCRFDGVDLKETRRGKGEMMISATIAAGLENSLCLPTGVVADK
ncbi:hypothetical protein Q3G72_017808 [Acer saccharum]|nr:hypothetical protein Q3G72_017808 [Acer saccharum]